MKGYRIVEVKNGKVYSLFHGTNHSREIPLDQWYMCDKKRVKDGKGRSYRSGFHFLKSRREAEEFLDSMFKIRTNRYVVACYVRGHIRQKNPGQTRRVAYLANEILIKSKDIGGIV